MKNLRMLSTKVNNNSYTDTHTHDSIFIGKPVLKKKVKFTIIIAPVQRRRGSTASADQINPVFDSQTHSLTFQQISGILFIYTHHNSDRRTFYIISSLGPVRRFYRVCDKIQAVIADPGIVNPLVTDFVDHENPSGSSDDTLTLHVNNGGSHDSGKGSSASAEVLVHRVPISGSQQSSNVVKTIMRHDSTDSEDDLLDD